MSLLAVTMTLTPRESLKKELPVLYKNLGKAILLVIETPNTPRKAKDVRFEFSLDLPDEQRGVRIAADGDHRLVGGQVPDPEHRVGVDVGRVIDGDELSVSAGNHVAGHVHVSGGGFDDIRPKQALDRVHLVLGEQRVQRLQELDDGQTAGLVAKHEKGFSVGVVGVERVVDAGGDAVRNARFSQWQRRIWCCTC